MKFVACTACLLVVTAVAPAASAADPGLLVDITTVTDDAELTTIKQADGVAWWVEIGEHLLVAGNGARATADRFDLRIVRDLGRLSSDELVLHARGCGDNTAPVPDERVVLIGGSYDLVRQPRSFSSLAPAAAPSAYRSDLGGSEWVPVEPNSTLARLRRFDLAGDIKGRQTDQIDTLVARVDPTRWFANVSTLASWDRSSFAPVDLGLARQWIASQFDGLGLEVDEPFFTFTHFSGTGSATATVANVIGKLQGVVHPDQWLVVGAHYDSRNPDIFSTIATPGADDNASGCAGVIEAANAIVDYLPQRSILFMCYAGEEQGLRGSNAHVNTLTTDGDLTHVQAMLNMDMIGWSPDATLGVIAETRPGTDNEALATRLADAALTYVPALDRNHVVTATNSCCSDHMPYISAGRPGVLSIHRLRASTPHYHRTTDTPTNLGPHAQDIGPAIVRMNVAALAQLAGLDRILRADNDPD